jgi:hypothetical protein
MDLKMCNFTLDYLLPFIVRSSFTKYVKMFRPRNFFQRHIKLQLNFPVGEDLHEMWHIIRNSAFNPHNILSLKFILFRAETARSEK